ncbi:amidohydrolase family protein [Aliikangiella sp. G2MR2-5]|uniref:amidohydrolase family protein n=1 Tax=Aliikangiella sp. G2MR2-5 TaxID=2788943 RepID=UPI0018AA185F|nr:amidohydrolase family protein [Aliikangiella sp. G2MR2-5]
MKCSALKLCSGIGLSVFVAFAPQLQATESESFLIKNATLHTATAKGRLDHADLRVANGKIQQIGVNLEPQEGDKVFDATGKHVTPGLMNARTQLGLVEISAVESTNDTSTEMEGMGASFNIAPAINFHSTLIPQNRTNGLTRALVMPYNGNNLFAGEGALILLRSEKNGLIKQRAVQSAVYGSAAAGMSGGSRAAAYARLEKALSEATYVRSNLSQFKPGIKYEFSQSLDDLKALIPVLTGQVPLVIEAGRADDILNLIALKKKFGFKLVVSGAGEAWQVAKELAEGNVPVLMDPIANIPSFDALTVRLDGAAKLYEAGVKLIFTGGGTHNAYLVRQSAGNAVANGLPHTAAIEAMTINAAEVFGVKNYGQLEPGMDADVVIWDGDPLEVTSNTYAVFIQGERQSMVSRATRLRDRYWQLKGSQTGYSR